TGLEAAGAAAVSIASSIGRTLSTGLAVATAATVALGASAWATGSAYNALEQTARAAFSTLLGGAEPANEIMAEIADFAKSSPFPRQVFIEGAQRLIAFGAEADSVVRTMGAVQDAVAAAGGSSQQLEDVIFV